MTNNIMNIISPFYTFVGRVFLCLCFPFIVEAQHFEFSPALKEAYAEITKLNFHNGKHLISEIKANDPDNFLVYHIENYIDFFQCFIDEDEDYFDSIRNRKDQRIYKIQSGDESSPYYLFSQAEILLQWALVRLKFEEYTTALFEINKAIKLLEKNTELFPNFESNKKSLSALHALVGTIPEQYKNIISWVSAFNGTIEQGYREISELNNSMDASTYTFSKEVIVIKSLIELHLLNDRQLAYESFHNSMVDSKTNPLLCFIKSNISHKAGKNDEAIEILENFQQGEHQHPLYYLDYLLGIYKLNRLDPDSDRYIRRYLNYFEGQNYIKEAYQKLAWYEWVINNDSLEYKRNMEFCLTKGNDLIDEDKQALAFAKKKGLPNKDLLKARLLDDGGYEEKALEYLISVEPNLRSPNDEIEYLYRRARVAQDLNQLEEARVNFEKCLSLPINNKLYFQTAASLYLGQVYEKKKLYEKALEWYEFCLDQNPAQYKSSLHQKAIAGIDRIQD